MVAALLLLGQLQMKAPTGNPPPTGHGLRITTHGRRRLNDGKAPLRNPYRVILLGSTAPKYTGEPISLDLKDADLRDVLLTFSKLTGLNIVIDPDVKGSVTVRLHDVPWDQALEVILRSNGLGDVMEGNVARIGPPGKL
jgi:type II secretory pathway component GspD/PulD (secretin)